MPRRERGARPTSLLCLFRFESAPYFPAKAAAVCGDEHLRLHELKISPGTTCAALLHPVVTADRIFITADIHGPSSAQICICITRTQVSLSMCVCVCPALTHLHLGARTHTAETDNPPPPPPKKKQFVKLTRTYRCNASCHRISSRG